MFLPLFYLLLANSIQVTLDEWLLLLEGLRQGLHRSTLSGFYTLCRAVAVTSEKDYDRFDAVFHEFFQGITPGEQLPQEMLEWLDHPELSSQTLEHLTKITGLTKPEIEELFARRLQEQNEEHNGGKHWVGTDGYTAYGNHGKTMGGIRVGGSVHYHSAYRTAGERRYRDWRGDNTLDSRQAQLAFRSLRQLSRDTGQPKTELDICATIQETCNHGGSLRVVNTYSRKNNLKLLLLIDSGGSMEPYQRLCSLLFQSVSRAGHFRNLKIYYFHNCVSSLLYTEPALHFGSTVSTEMVLKSTAPDYRVILVGDGEMALDELLGGSSRRRVQEVSGLNWLLRFKARYSHIIWLHPQSRPAKNSYWMQTFTILEQHFPMYRLSLEGLTQGMKKLLENR